MTKIWSTKKIWSMTGFHHCGVYCEIVAYGGHYCGYVILPEEHPLFAETSTTEVDTYIGQLPGEWGDEITYANGEGRIGFDTGHGWQQTDGTNTEEHAVKTVKVLAKMLLNEQAQ